VLNGTLVKEQPFRSMHYWQRYNLTQGLLEKSKLAQHAYVYFLLQVLTGLGSQLCILWGKEDGLNVRPPNFSTYLDAILTFSRHPSLTLVHYANSLWMSFFKHEHISKDKVFLTFIPKWVECTAPKITRVCTYDCG
jgi:exportin-5